MRINRSISVYTLLFAIWAGILVWQVMEHRRVRNEIHNSLHEHSRLIARSMGVVFRSQNPFFRVRLDETRLVAALKELMVSDSSSGLLGVAVLNPDRDVVAEAGSSIETRFLTNSDLPDPWDEKTSSVLQMVALRLPDDSASRTVAIVVPPPREYDRGTTGGQRGFGPRRDMDGSRGGFNGDQTSMSQLGMSMRRDMEGMRGGRPPGMDDGRTSMGQRRGEMAGDRGDGRGRGGRGGDNRGRGPGGPRDQRMERERGAHSIVFLMSTESYLHDIARDKWMRSIMVLIVLIATVGIGASWQTMIRNSAIEARLIRASEVNVHLQEMNLAAAGLAHETRNPLNIVRGQAQMIAKSEGLAPEIINRVRAIVEESDRASARLNQFLDYSKPRQVRPAPTDLSALVREVTRMMQSDIEDKGVTLNFAGFDVIIEADDTLLRQVLFNLVLNAIQAVDFAGHIEVAVRRDKGFDHWLLNVSDDGHGVPPESREQIFRPYFTTNAAGTGLGLAVVRQIVLAHQWEIHYIPNEPRGARFRISGMKGSQKVAR